MNKQRVEIDSDTDSDNFIELPGSKKYYLKGKNVSTTTDQDFMTIDNILKRENESTTKMPGSFMDKASTSGYPSN